MLSAIVSFSVRFRILVIGAVVVLLAVGIPQLRTASVDEFPEFAPPQVQVQAEALGLSAAEVEQLITVPLEQDLLNGVPWLDQIRSESVPGLSTIDMIFKPGTELLQARQMVQEHLTQAHALPQVGTPPVMIQPTSATGRVLMVALRAEDLSLVELSILARWKIKPRLEGLPGVANVAIWGQRDRQLQVQVDPAKLRAYGVSLNQVVSTTGNALWVSPLTFVEASTPGTGGFVDTANQRFGIQHVTPITTAAGLSAVTVEDTAGKTLRLGQVATVVEDHQPLIGDAVLDGSPGLMLVIQKFPGANTREVTSGVEEALEEMKPGLSGVAMDSTVYRPASFLDDALRNLAVRGALGLLLLAALLVGYLVSWRAAVVTLVSMGTSMLASAYVLYLRGATFNVMVLAGLLAASVTVIADSVTDVHALHRLSHAGKSLSDRSADRSVPVASNGHSDPDRTTAFVAASRTVRAPLIYATLIVLLLPLPALLIGGVPGRLSRPAILSYALAIAVSMLVALLVTPALAAYLLGREGGDQRAAPLAKLAERAFDAAAGRMLRRPRALLAAAAVLVLATLTVIPQLRSDRVMLPTFQDRELTVHLQAAAGTSLPEMQRLTARAGAELRGLPGVRDVGSHVGRALMADQSVNVDSAELWLSLDESADYGSTVDRVTRVVQGYPGIRAEVSTYPAERLATAKTGITAPLLVRVYGHDLDQLAAKAEDVRRMLSGVRGVVRPSTQPQRSEPSLQVKVKLAEAQRYGITPGDVRRASATLFAGLPVGSLYEDQKIFDVVVWGVPEARRRPADVANLMIDTDRGQVRLGAVADVRIVPAPTVIHHDNISRSLDVTADVSGRSVDSVLREVKSQLAGLPMPLEFHAEVFSGSTEQSAEDTRVALAAVAVAVAILLLLQAALGSWRLAALLLVSAPFGAAGGVLAALPVGGIRSLGALLGILAVLGLVLRNGLLLFSRYQQGRGGEPATTAADVLELTRQQVGPTVLSALLTAALLVPLAVLPTVGGTELVHPFAVVVIGGLVSAVLLNLLVLPALYLRIVGHRRNPSEGVRELAPDPVPAAV
jgi:CzcA family heavy metal efflux pump